MNRIDRYAWGFQVAQGWVKGFFLADNLGSIRNRLQVTHLEKFISQIDITGIQIGSLYSEPTAETV